MIFDENVETLTYSPVSFLQRKLEEEARNDKKLKAFQREDSINSRKLSTMTYSYPSSRLNNYSTQDTEKCKRAASLIDLHKIGGSKTRIAEFGSRLRNLATKTSPKIEKQTSNNTSPLQQNITRISTKTFNDSYPRIKRRPLQEDDEIFKEFSEYITKSACREKINSFSSCDEDMEFSDNSSSTAASEFDPDNTITNGDDTITNEDDLADDLLRTLSLDSIYSHRTGHTSTSGYLSDNDILSDDSSDNKQKSMLSNNNTLPANFQIKRYRKSRDTRNDVTDSSKTFHTKHGFQSSNTFDDDSNSLRALDVFATLPKIAKSTIIGKFLRKKQKKGNGSMQLKDLFEPIIERDPTLPVPSNNSTRGSRFLLESLI